MPLERLFFDTNIVCNIRWICNDPTFEDGFHDFKSQKFLKMGRELRADCVALRWLIDKDDEFGLQFVTSQSVLQEVSKTQNTKKRDELQEILCTLKSHFRENQIEFLEESNLPNCTQTDDGFCTQLLQKSSLDFLPQKMDRLLITDSLRMRCHVFLTTDIKTIWRYRRKLGKIGINVRRPVEYVSTLHLPLSPGNIGLLPYGNIDEVLSNLTKEHH